MTEELCCEQEKYEDLSEYETSGYLDWLWKQETQHIKLADTFNDGLVQVKTPKGDTHFTCPNSLPAPNLWPERPLLLRESRVHYNWDAMSSKSPISTNGIAYPFETDLFIGHILYRSRNTPGSEAYFEGKNRLNSILISGKFKKELGFSEVLTGQEFCKQVKQPSFLIVQPVLKFFKLLAPLLQIFIGKQTYFLSPLAQTSQIIQVTKEPMKLEPGTSLVENFCETVLAQSLSNVERKKYFSNKSNLKGSFKTDCYYSFDFYQDKLDMDTFTLKILGSNYDIQQYLRGQPLRILSRINQTGDPSTQYLWNFELWHEKVIEHIKN